MGYKPSSIDQCVYLKEDSIIVCYVDDCIIFAKNEETIKQIYGQLKDRNFVFTEEGDVTEYLGIKINHHRDRSMRLSQPYLLKQIIDSISGMEGANPREIPAMLSVTLTKNCQGKPRKGNWNYRSVIGMLNFVAKCAHLDIECLVHRCARFCKEPKLLHEVAV